MRREGRAPLLKQSRRPLVKRETNLDNEQRFRPRDLLRYNLKTVRAYLLKEAFQQLWGYNSPTWAGKFPRRIVSPDHVVAHRADEEIARALRQHHELIPNYSRAQKLISIPVAWWRAE